MFQRVLITGASGFIGRFIFETVADSALEVRTAGRRCPEFLNCEKSNHFFIEEIEPDTDWSTAIKDVDVVVHVAGVAHVKRPKTPDIANFHRINVLGTERLVKAAVDAGVKRFIFISSIAVFGRSSGDVINENTSLSPSEPYGDSKAKAEDRLVSITHGTRTDWVIVRPPMVYGPNAPGNLGALKRLIGFGLPLPLASIRNERSFLSVWNLADFILLCCWHPQALGQAFLVRDGRNLSTVELIKLMADVMQVRLFLTPFPPFLLKALANFFGKGEVFEKLCGSLVVDDSKARKLLNWNAPVSVEDGLRRSLRVRP